MRVLLTVSALAAALAAAPVAATAAAPHVRLFAPVMLHGATASVTPPGAPATATTTSGAIAIATISSAPPARSSAKRPNPGLKSAPSPFVVSAPVFVNVTFAPAAGPQRGWTDGPKIIEIGRSAPPRGRLPLVIYGD